MTMMVQSQPTAPDALARALVRIRLGQLLVNEQLKAGAFRIPIHLALGHEAIAAAVAAVMTGDDALCLTHRNIHYNLARALSLRAELDELHLAEGGIGGGRFGSMNLCNPERGVIYTSSILANALCVSTGVALGAKVRGLDAVTFAVTGDGAMEEGAFYETLQTLKTFGLAALIVIENNQWSLATSITERRCPIDIAAIAAAFDCRYVGLSGNDVFAYAQSLSRLRAETKATASPIVVEVTLNTLGGAVVPLPGGAGERVINYHHGVASTAASLSWPLLQDDAKDPLHVLIETLGREAVAKIAQEVLAVLQEEIGQ